MPTFRVEETIDRPPAEVWAYAADLTHHTEWMGVTASELLAGRPTEAGARGRQTMRFGPVTRDYSIELEEAEPGRTATWAFERPRAFRGRVGLELSAAGSAATHVVYRGRIELQGAWRLLAPLIALELRENEPRELRRLKELLESGATVSADPAAAS